MKNPARYIPNTLTCFNLAFGFYASILGLSGNYRGAMIAILIAAVFDFADGLAARLLKAYSPMGKELDSLADLVSFGVAPGMMLYRFLDQLVRTLSWDGSWLFLLSAFAIPVLSGLRLARFNIDDRQKTSFIGLPVPAHAILWSSLLTAFAPALTVRDAAEAGDGLLAAFSLVAFSLSAVVTSLLLVSAIPMFSLKITSFVWKENGRQYILALSAVLFVALFGVVGISATILLYILLSLVTCRRR
jgi:CDP-diacylglycerol--serine O-phosphatidyltransferase